MMNGRRSTIKDVASRAGVSISTVSRTLSGKLFVEEATRKKVLEAVNALDYEPNMVARGLKESKSKTIAVVLPDLNSLYYASLLEGIEEVAAQKGYHVFICNSRDDEDREAQIIDTLGKRAVDGILCLTVNNDVEHIRRHRKIYKTSIVFINRNLDPDIPSIGVDMEHGGYLMTSYLIGKGHKKIAGIFAKVDKARNMERLEGYRTALWKNKLEERSEYICEDVETMSQAAEAAKRLMELPEPPTAIFASEQFMVLGVYQGIASKGLRIPEEISVVGFDNVITTPYYSPALTTYDSKAKEIAIRGAEMLFEAMENKKMSLEHLTVQGVVIERDSVRDLNIN